MDRSALLHLHSAAGARLRTGVEPPVVLTHGDVPAEYRAAQESVAMFDETDRGRVGIAGEDAAAFLHRIVASDVRALAPGRGQRCLLLSSKGKVLFDLDLFRAESGLWASVANGRAGALLAALDTYLFAEKVRLSDTSAAHAPIALCGPAAAAVLRQVAGVVPPSEDRAWASVASGGRPLAIARIPIAGSPGFLVDGGPGAAPDLWERLRAAGARPAGAVVRDILRVEAGAAAFGEDVDENVYPQEARLEEAFSLTKGCYVGQEVVAKIDTYGGLNKRLVALRIDRDDPVPRGTRLVREEDGETRDLGVVTSWAYSFALDAGLALGYVKRRHQEPGTAFRLGEGGATATIVPLPVRGGVDPSLGVAG